MRLLCSDQGLFLPETSKVELRVHHLRPGGLCPERVTAESSRWGHYVSGVGGPRMPHSWCSTWYLSIEASNLFLLNWGPSCVASLSPRWELWGVQEGLLRLSVQSGPSRSESRFGQVSEQIPLFGGGWLSPQSHSWKSSFWLLSVGWMHSWETPHSCKVLRSVPNANLAGSCPRVDVRWRNCNIRQGSEGRGGLSKNTDADVFSFSIVRVRLSLTWLRF